MIPFGAPSRQGTRSLHECKSRFALGNAGPDPDDHDDTNDLVDGVHGSKMATLAPGMSPWGMQVLD